MYEDENRDLGPAAEYAEATYVAELAAAVAPGKLIVSHLPVYGDRNEILQCIKTRWKGEVLLARPFLVTEV